MQLWKFLPRVAIKRQVLVDFVAVFSPRTVTPELGCLASAHSKEMSSARTLASIEPAPEDPEVCKEPSQGAEESMTENINEDLELRKEPPQIDHSTTWKILVDGVKHREGQVSF